MGLSFRQEYEVGIGDYQVQALELNSGNLGSQCEAVMAVASRLMNSRGGNWCRGCDRFGN